MFEFFLKIADRQVAKDMGDYCRPLKTLVYPQTDKVINPIRIIDPITRIKPVFP